MAKFTKIQKEVAKKMGVNLKDFKIGGFSKSQIKKTQKEAGKKMDEATKATENNKTDE